MRIYHTPSAVPEYSEGQGAPISPDALVNEVSELRINNYLHPQDTMMSNGGHSKERSEVYPGPTKADNEGYQNRSRRVLEPIQYHEEGQEHLDPLVQSWNSPGSDAVGMHKTIACPHAYAPAHAQRVPMGVYAVPVDRPFESDWEQHKLRHAPNNDQARWGQSGIYQEGRNVPASRALNEQSHELNPFEPEAQAWSNLDDNVTMRPQVPQFGVPDETRGQVPEGHFFNPSTGNWYANPPKNNNLDPSAANRNTNMPGDHYYGPLISNRNTNLPGNYYPDPSTVNRDTYPSRQELIDGFHSLRNPADQKDRYLQDFVENEFTRLYNDVAYPEYLPRYPSPRYY